MLRMISLGAALLMPLAAQGQDAAGEGWPRSLTDPLGEVVIEAPPQNIASTAPSLTGILLAIGAPVKSTSTALIGPLTDDKGYFLQWAAEADAQGVEPLYPNLTFDIETVILADPDLVIASATGGDAILPFVPALQAQGLKVLVLDYSSGSWEDLARQLGRATGHEAGAEKVIRDFADQAQAVAQKLTVPAGTVSVVSYNFSGTYAVSKPTSPQAKLLAELGFTVSGLPEALAGAAERSSDFDFVSHENLAAAIAGEGVFLLNGTEESVAAFMADPVLANLPAVKAGQVWPLGPTSFRVDYYSGLDILNTVSPYFIK
ncbi:Fe2+-enterobactin ABC transporter substrate-binding protein [Xinfangfangia sp. D13-10-4-6]|uniref:Fe2+-enterobactin ABC transporter substrate-binding protein n=1 Tax=Pseudogemmobacter hezensis TaxID=2737662 RepID=UPI001552A676|nr:Fe2+-enterobactin ABC transporter substrate-binding protein [Pseudogemmobacter hezensis]NPD14010.1 Fe2+-enterobactin ABC transporter substrate-binding protein [Pseudogemmobacter hezensis]